MGTMKGFNDYVNNRDERLYKLQEKIGFDMNENLQAAYKTNYTPTGNKNDITHFLTRRDSEEAEAERVRRLQEINDKAKANIDKILNKSNPEKASTQKSAGLNPLEKVDEADKVNRKYMSIKDKNEYDTKKANEYIEKYGYLDKKADKETRDKYYSEYMKSIGYSDEEINDALGFGGQVSMNEGFLGKINSAVRNTLAPGFEEGPQILTNMNEKANGSKIGNFVSGLIGNTTGLMVNPGGGLAGNANMLNIADDLAEGVANKVLPMAGKGIQKVGNRVIRGAVDGAIGGGLQTLKEDDPKNMGTNIAQGALGGALMFGGQKALGEIGNAFKGSKKALNSNNVSKNIETPDNVRQKEVELKDFDDPRVSGNLNPLKVENNFKPIVPEKTNVDVGRDLTNIKEVGDRSVKLLSNEMGELRPYLKEEAEATLRELQDVIKGERFAHYDDFTGETIVTGTKKQVSPTIQAIQDLIPNASYDKIRKGLNDIIEGKDTSIAKKIELILDDNLSNGRFSGNEGIEVPAVKEYLQIKELYKQLNEGDSTFGGRVNYEASVADDVPRLDNTIKIEDNGPILDEVAATKYADGEKPNRFANETVLKSEQADDILKEGIKNQDITYDPITNKETLENAQALIDSDFNKAYAMVMQDGKEVTAETMAIGQDLVRILQNEGRYAEAVNILEKLTRDGTQSGQAIQALSMWRRMTPEGMLTFAQRQINKVNDNLPKGAKKVELDDSDIIGITERMSKVQELPDSREKDILLAEVSKIVQNKIPSKFMDKVDSFRYINMLFNPKTLIKNAGGNIVNTTMGNLRDVIATPIDKVVSNFTGERTVGLPNLKEQARGLVDGVKTVTDDYRRGIDTTNTVREGTRANAFDEGTFMGGIERLLSAGLKMGDVPFYEAAKNNYLANVTKLNGVDTPTTKMLEDAHQAGLEATFQQRTGLGDAISGLKNNKNKAVATTAKTILPFSQTPSAILDTSINYTPLGIARGSGNLAKGNQRQGVNQLASGILGTGAIGAGVGLAKNGVLTGQLSDDSKTAALQRQAGMQPYAIKNGDYYYSIDFAQPAASPLMTGADIVNGNLNPLETAVNSILENSYLSGLKDIGDTISSDGWGAVPGEIIRNYASQLLPFSSLSSQVTKTIDPTVRDTYDPNANKRFANQAMSKYPGLSQQLPQAVDTVGEDRVYNEGAGLAERALRNFILPFNVSEYQPNDVEEKALNIYNETGETIQVPRYAKDTVSYGGGKTYALTAEEKREYSKALAEALRKSKADSESMSKAMTQATKEFNDKIKKRYNLKK